MPGISAAIVWIDRAVGSASRTSSLSTRCWTTLRMSTLGAWPDTVIVSLTLPTLSSAFTVAGNAATTAPRHASRS